MFYIRSNLTSLFKGKTSFFHSFYPNNHRRLVTPVYLF